MFQFDATRTASKIVIRIYTAAFRRVLEETVNGPYTGISTVSIAAYKISRLANGTYYVVLLGEGAAGEKAVSNPMELIILR
jgi:hypothetical protein